MVMFYVLENRFERKIDRVAVEGRPSTVSLPKPCVRLSPHTETFQLSVAVYALGDDNHFYFIPYS